MERIVSTLSTDQKEAIKKLSGEDYTRSTVFNYRATREGAYIGSAYFDMHRVRSLRQTLMIVVDREDKIARIELLSFGEPREYIPSGRWYAQFLGKKLGKDLSLKGSIKGVTGATLTARATTNAARKLLALHEILKPAAARPESRKVSAKGQAQK